MTNRRVPWFAWPIALLVVGIAVAGFALYDILDSRRSDRQAEVNLNAARTVTCGNGVCENVACLSVGCPDPETAETCPVDCGSENASPPDDRNLDPDRNVNLNVNADSASGPDVVLMAQSAADAAACPVSGANMAVEDVAAAAGRLGLQPGVKTIQVRFGLSESPLDQCIWTVRNFLTTSSGTEIVLIDATQDVLRTVSWSE